MSSADVNAGEAKLVLQDAITQIDDCVLKLIRNYVIGVDNRIEDLVVDVSLLTQDTSLELYPSATRVQIELEFHLCVLQKMITHYSITTMGYNRPDLAHYVQTNMVGDSGLMFHFRVGERGFLLYSKFDWVAHIPAELFAILGFEQNR